jgi:hypothetical protein
MFATDSILPPEPEGLETLHDREYRIRAFRKASDRLLIQGAVRDQKPPGLYVTDDPEPMTIHHMSVSLEVSFPDLEILDVTVHFEAHPTSACPSIVEQYGNLVGLSIARGFTHKIRELFGGPRGCTHTTALLQAMAPVAMQCFRSMHAAEARLKGEPNPISGSDRGNNESWKRIIGTCHVWDPDGPHVARRMEGMPEQPPLFLKGRLGELAAEHEQR